jgi:hypothetical protein
MSVHQLDVKLTDQLEREWMESELQQGNAATENESALLMGVYLAVVALAALAAVIIVNHHA